MTTLTHIAPGYYYHYKHNPTGTVNNYAYYILGVGHHTEDDCRPEDQLMMVYQPLYREAHVYQNGRMFDLRPHQMFFDPAMKEGVSVRRFTPVSDPTILEQLASIRADMYAPFV